MDKKQIHPNSLANLSKGGRHHEPIKNLARKIREHDDTADNPLYKMLFEIAADSEKDSDRIHAIELLLTRGYGKPLDTTLIVDESTPLAALEDYDLEQLIDMRQAILERQLIAENKLIEG